MNLLWKNASRFYCGVAISKVRTSLAAFEKCFPKSMVYSDANDDVMERTVAFADMFASNEDWPMDDLMINIDDGSTKNNALNSEVLKALTLQGRHLSITVVVAAQYFKVVSPQIRNNASRILFGREPNANTRKKVWEEFFMDAFPEREVFDAVMDKLTMNYAFLGVDCTENGGAISDMVFQFKGQADVPHFRIGHRDIWLLDNLKRLRKSQCSMTNIFRRLRGEEPVDGEGRGGAPLPAIDEEGGGDEDEDDAEDGHGHHIHDQVDADGMAVVCPECVRQEARGKVMTPEEVAATAVECEKRAALEAKRAKRAARLQKKRERAEAKVPEVEGSEPDHGTEIRMSNTLARRARMSVRFDSSANEPTDMMMITGLR